MAASAVPFPIEEATIAALRAAYLGGPGDRNIGVPSHLDRIAVYDRKGPALGAILIDNPDALADAAALDAALESTGKLTGPLHGILILVKDNYDVAGLRTTGVPGRCWVGSPRQMPQSSPGSGPQAGSSPPKQRCPNGREAAWTTSIPCCPVCAKSLQHCLRYGRVFCARSRARRAAACARS